MKKLEITKEQFNRSKYLQKKYGTLKFVSESGNYYKTDKGQVLELYGEAREYVDDNSIDLDSVEEFIIFDDPEIFDKIANTQERKCEEVQQQVQSGEVTPADVAKAADKAATKSAMATIGAGVASSAINAATSIATSKAALGVAAAIGYKQVLDKAGEMGEEVGGKVGTAYADWRYGDENNRIDDLLAADKIQRAEIAKHFTDQAKLTNLDPTLLSDKRAIYIADCLKNGDAIKSGGAGLGNVMGRDEALDWMKKNGYEINKDGNAVKIASNVAQAGAAGAAGAATGAGGWTLFGMSAATVGWIVAGVAAAAIITPYIYDKVRACTKTWMADIIAEVKFKADGKNYRCFYDLKENKWVLTYADIKWTSYLDNKLDKETEDDFFASKFFNDFLSKCRQTFAILFSTGKNEVVFKTLPEIKDAPKELKSILEKIYDNKGAITKNLFTGNH